MKYRLALAGLGFLALATTASLAEARITRIEILKSEPAFAGASFGEVGRYEHLVGRVGGEIDPAAGFRGAKNPLRQALVTFRRSKPARAWGRALGMR